MRRVNFRQRAQTRAARQGHSFFRTTRVAAGKHCWCWEDWSVINNTFAVSACPAPIACPAVTERVGWPVGNCTARARRVSAYAARPRTFELRPNPKLNRFVNATRPLRAAWASFSGFVRFVRRRTSQLRGFVFSLPFSRNYTPAYPISLHLQIIRANARRGYTFRRCPVSHLLCQVWPSGTVPRASVATVHVAARRPRGASTGAFDIVK